MITSEHSILADSGGPGQFRGGCGAQKGGTLTEAKGTVMSYCCDRARSITWGIQGGLPSIPQGVWLRPGDEDDARYLGAIFSNVPVGRGRLLHACLGRWRRLRRPARARPGARARRRRRRLRHRSSAHARLRRRRCARSTPTSTMYEIDEAGHRRASEPLSAPPGRLARGGRGGRRCPLPLRRADDARLVRRYGVILDWGVGLLLPRTTEQFPGHATTPRLGALAGGP